MASAIFWRSGLSARFAVDRYFQVEDKRRGKVVRGGEDRGREGGGRGSIRSRLGNAPESGSPADSVGERLHTEPQFPHL